VQRLGRRARLVDQMALAHYLSGDHAAAQDRFGRAAALLEELIERDRGGRRAYTRNLLRARRNQALNIYHAVRSGRMSETHLQRAWDLFEATLDALDAVGVVQQQDEAAGLITIEIEVAVGEEAGLARFDIEAEKRLIYTYLARISARAGRFEEAAALMEKKLALYPDLPEDTERLDMLSERAIVWSQLAGYQLRAAYRLRGGALKAAAEAFSSALRLDERAQNLEGQMGHCRSLGRVALRMARLPEAERGMPDEELKAWLRRIIALHRDLLAESAERQAASLAKPAVGLSANLAELAPLVEEADRAP
jgi:tetratricopeptide (TPR) repeat protein